VSAGLQEDYRAVKERSGGLFLAVVSGEKKLAGVKIVSSSKEGGVLSSDSRAEGVAAKQHVLNNRAFF